MHLSGKNNEGKFQQAVIYQTQASFLLGKFTLGHLYMQVCRCMHSDLKVKFKLGNWLIHDQNKTRCVSSHNMYLGQKSYVRVKFYLKLRNLNFSFRKKIKQNRRGVCNMRELHFKIGRRVGKVILQKSCGELCYLYQCSTQDSGPAKSCNL